ncbi:hypothetical protein SLV14_003826 [Streptomyces sp. Je 1-4]|uniref:hypothetical protein n=1 Tax=Streptomyces TaxID=1883 RepID=UPI0021D7E8B6|nr:MULTISPECIES: hypothetical protein [unclassified Streptomyces]UYB41128.1 hypothetical protein SLV14_003826 [Streptomyces sp. Je 1-4]UZQ37298.1 hypothetical protein SLV14N_003826 [Streptomyces sp. Je 1-4] [Streptomyces sp. Je 1-4 4N24]UZQ44715.1 hypothetical protein SLV14NA_003826 [Streptomyces sp. Je 1-4] [Streptomyces sp. Je 1-4 4N24_ara]
MTDTSTSTRRSPLLVPLFALLGVGGLTAYSKADDAHVAAEWAHCGDLPLTWQIYLSAYGALACGIVALALFWWLARRARRRGTWVGDSWPGKLAIVAVVIDVLLVALQFFVVWYLYQPSPGGPISCV